MIIDERESLEYKRIKDTYTGVIFTDTVNGNVRLYNGNGDILPFTIENDTNTGSIKLSSDTVNANVMEVTNNINIDNLTSFNITTNEMKSNDCYLTTDGTLSNHAVKVEQVNNVFTNIVNTAKETTNKGCASQLSALTIDDPNNNTILEFTITQDMINNDHYIVYIISCNFSHNGDVNGNCKLIRTDDTNGEITLTENFVLIDSTKSFVRYGGDTTTFIHTEKAKNITTTPNTKVTISCKFDDSAGDISIKHLDALILNGE
mgnify:CR=1 FL=1